MHVHFLIYLSQFSGPVVFVKGNSRSGLCPMGPRNLDAHVRPRLAVLSAQKRNPYSSDLRYGIPDPKRCLSPDRKASFSLLERRKALEDIKIIRRRDRFFCDRLTECMLDNPAESRYRE